MKFFSYFENIESENSDEINKKYKENKCKKSKY